MPDPNAAGTPDVIIVGAGVVGASTARELAEAGARVLLIDRETSPGSGSRAAAGVGVPSVRLLTDPPMLDFAVQGRQSLADDLTRLATPHDGLVRECGLIRLIPDRAEADRLSSLAAGHGDFLGTWANADELADLEPGWRGKAYGAFVHPSAAVVNAAGYVDALVRAASGAGVTVRTGCELRAVVGDDSGVTVHLPDGPVHAESLVLACGAWTGSVPGLATLPIRPVRGQMIRVEADPTRPVRHIVSGPLYLAPAPDGRTVLVGATEEEAEFADGPTVEAALLLLAHVARNWPGLRGARLCDIWYGFRAVTPDGRPLIGRLPEQPRIVVAAGHGGQGILTGAYTGQLVTALLRGEQPAELRHFDPARIPR